MSDSEGEEVLFGQLRMLRHSSTPLPMPVRQYQGVPGRDYRSDFAWPEQKLAVEVDGGTWSGGRHTRGGGYAEDCVKINELECLGWHVIRCTTEQVTSGQALAWVERLLRNA
jgi:very-short-patch-repair endonuclease